LLYSVFRDPDIHLAEGWRGAGQETRKGIVFARRKSCPTARIFSASGSRGRGEKDAGVVVFRTVLIKRADRQADVEGNQTGTMARPIRIEYAAAIYHVMARVHAAV
jgi:hypothetical protein